MTEQLYKPFIFLEKFDFGKIAAELDRYGFMGYGDDEYREVSYHIYTNTSNNCIVEFGSETPFPEFVFITMDLHNHKVIFPNSKIFGFYPISDGSVIAREYEGIVALYSDEEIKCVDTLEKMKVITINGKSYIFDSLDFIPLEIPPEIEFPTKFLHPTKEQFIEEGFIYFEREDYEAEFLEFLAFRKSIQ